MVVSRTSQMLTFHTCQDDARSPHRYQVVRDRRKAQPACFRRGGRRDVAGITRRDALTACMAERIPECHAGTVTRGLR